MQAQTEQSNSIVLPQMICCYNNNSFKNISRPLSTNFVLTVKSHDHLHKEKSHGGDICVPKDKQTNSWQGK